MQVFTELHETKGLRAVFVKSTGAYFCAGADLQWMKKTTTYSESENQADAERLGAMLNKFNTLPCPTVALIQVKNTSGST